MQFKVWAALTLTLVSLSGCATASGNFCDVARAVRPSVEDRMTEETKRQILRENEKLAKLCGVTP
jgi:hypothetical protein